MENNLLSNINTEFQQNKVFAEWFGMPIADIPQEILDEAFGGRTLGMTGSGEQMGQARGRAGENEWVRDMADKRGGPQAKPSTFRDPTQAGAPQMSQSEGPKAGDFVVVGGKPVKIVDVKTMFGNTGFAYLQGQQKPMATDRLAVAKKVGNVTVYKVVK